MTAGMQCADALAAMALLGETVTVTTDCPNPKCKSTRAEMATAITSGPTVFTCIDEACEHVWWDEIVEPDTCFIGWCSLPPGHADPCRGAT